MAIGSQGRGNQRERTRAAIIAAAIALLRAGAAPSMAEIAEAAGVSRRTVYLHFPTIDQLLTDARIGLLTQQSVDAAIAIVDPGGDVETRVEAMIDAVIENARETLPLGRALIRLTVESPVADGAPRRGYRRVAWIEAALAPIRSTLTTEQFDRLVSALAMVVGWEGLIVLADIRALDAKRQCDTVLWAARAILHAALSER